MIALTSVDIVTSPSSGLPLHVCVGVPGLNPRSLQDDVIMMDGAIRKVRRVDTFATYDPIGLPFMLDLNPEQRGDMGIGEDRCG